MDRRIQIVFWNLLHDAQFQFTCFAQLLKGTQRGRAFHIVDTRNAHRMHLAHGQFDGIDRLGCGGL